MTKIKDSEFVKDFSRGGDSIGININELSTDTQDKLKKVGVSKSDLQKIAGADGRISGENEFRKLFKVVDGFDKDKKYNSIETRDDKNAPTPSGELYDALKSEVDSNVAKANRQGIIHVGMRKDSKVEADALQNANSKHGGVHRIEAYKTEGVVDYNGAKHDLKTSAGRESYKKALISGPDKMDPAQAQKFVDFLDKPGIDGRFRDELAQLGTALHKAGNGKLDVNRLVISGHGTADGQIMDDTYEGFYLKDVKELAKIFPEGSKKIEHVAIAACFCGGKANFKDVQDAFPKLKSAFAYKEFSPEAGKGAESHLKQWAQMTDGADPSAVDPKFHKTASWNSVDGYQGFPEKTLAEANLDVNSKKFAFEAYQSGGTKKAVPTGKHDQDLDAYYTALSYLTKHEDFKTHLTGPEQKKLIERREEVLKLRLLVQSQPSSRTSNAR